MESPWRIERTYTETGIHWHCWLPGTSVEFEADTLWGDVGKAGSDVIENHVKSLLGDIQPDSIRINHYTCGDHTGRRWLRVEWVYMPNGARICADGLKPWEAREHLLAEAIRLQEHQNTK